MSKARLAALAAISSLAIFPSLAQASNACWYPNEARAAQVRGLQTMLMVGTLQCRTSNRYSVDLYNDFIRSQRSFLDANSYVLKGRFIRESGTGDGQRAYDRFGTSLANRYSAEFDRPEFCETVDHFVRVAARASREELLELANSVAEAPSSGHCPPTNYRFSAADQDLGQPEHARRHAPPPPPRIAIVESAPAPVAVAAAQTAVAPAVAPAVETAAAPAVKAKEAVIEKAVAAVAAVAPVQAPAPGKEEALQQAIVALQSAVAALQAASAAPAPVATPASAETPMQTIADSPVVPPQPSGQD